MCPGRPEAHSEEIVELAIERIGARGDGVAQYRGEPVFVPFTVPAIASALGLGHAAMAGRRASPSTGSPRARGVPLDAAVISEPAVVVRCSTWTTRHTGGSSWRHFRRHEPQRPDDVGINPDSR
jgi:hypothetical protein